MIEKLTSRQSLLAPETPEAARAIAAFAAKLIELNHDLNNPLAGVIGYLELAMSSEEGVHEEVKCLLQSAQLSADMMNDLIKKLSVAKQELLSEVDFSSFLTVSPEKLQ